jgi:hypothetical protein
VLLDIAERKPAKDVLSAAKSSRSKPRVSSMGSGIDGATLKVVAVAALLIAVVGGGVWYMMNSPSRPSGPKKSKSAAAKKAKTPPKKIRKSAD